MLTIAGEALGLLGCVLKRKKIAGEAIGLLGCVLKRRKILMKFNSVGPVFKNGPKF